MRINEHARIHKSTLSMKNDILLNSSTLDKKPSIQTNDTLDFSISAQEMNDWIEEAKRLLAAESSPQSNIHTDVTGKEVIMKVLGGMRHGGKHNENI